jgi:seryl-tRNA synthetase
MLDIQFIRDNADLVQQKAQQKNTKIDVDKLLQLDEQYRQKLQEVESLRSKRNQVAHMGIRPDGSIPGAEEGKRIKEQLSTIENEMTNLQVEFKTLLADVPNVFPEDTPIGGEEANQPVKNWGEPRQDKVIDHLTWGEQRSLIDFERGAKVAGNKFYFLKGSLVELELAVFQFTLNIATKHGFNPITMPHMVNTKTVEGTGFLPRGEEKQIYKIEGEDLHLIATAEIPITGYHAGEILGADRLPILYAGLSPAYRLEAGAYGKHSKGLYRVHQFNKLELYVFCKPQDSEYWHQKLVSVEEELCQGLGIPYQLVRIAAGDLGAPAYKKFDIEYWSPADQAYRELMSCSNVTDYQARRLNIKYRNQDGGIEYVHTLNGTAAAYSRMAIAIIENFQDESGNVHVPEVLRSYMGGREML